MTEQTYLSSFEERLEENYNALCDNHIIEETLTFLDAHPVPENIPVTTLFLKRITKVAYNIHNHDHTAILPYTKTLQNYCTTAIRRIRSGKTATEPFEQSERNRHVMRAHLHTYAAQFALASAKKQTAHCEQHAKRAFRHLCCAETLEKNRTNNLERAYRLRDRGYAAAHVAKSTHGETRAIWYTIAAEDYDESAALFTKDSFDAIRSYANAVRNWWNAINFFGNKGPLLSPFINRPIASLENLFDNIDFGAHQFTEITDNRMAEVIKDAVCLTGKNCFLHYQRTQDPTCKTKAARYLAMYIDNLHPSEDSKNAAQHMLRALKKQSAPVKSGRSSKLARNKKRNLLEKSQD